MLSGRYPSDEFAELRPRVTWDRVAGTISGARRRQARGDRQRRHDSRSRPVRRVPGRRRARRGARRRARRRDGVREPRRRDLRARRLVVAHRGDHARPRAGVAGARRAGQDAVLERRSRRPAARARARDRHADARPAAAAAGRRDRSADARARSRRARRREPARSTCAISWPPPRAVPDAAHDRHRARARRARRLARLRALAARRPHPRAVGDGGRRQDPRGDRHRRRNAVGRRWVRGAVSGRGPAAGSAAAAAGSGRGAGARRAAARRDGAVRREVPRERRPLAAAAEAAARACARRSGSSASAPPICWRSRRATDRFRCCSKPTASACATSSTCRR